jgi:hypothetical protein
MLNRRLSAKVASAARAARLKLRLARKEVAMLPPFIIEQIRKREEEKRRDDERPALRIPLDDVPPLMPEPHTDEDDSRGVVVIDLCAPSD